MLSTGVPIGQQSTIIIAMAMLLPGSETGIYQYFFGTSANNYPTDPTSSFISSVSPTANFSGVVDVGHYGIYDGTSERSVFGVPRIPISGGPSNGDPAVLAIRLDAGNDTMKLRANTGAEVSITRSEIGAHYAVDRGTIMLGTWKNAGVRTAASPHARLFGAAIYNRALSDTVLATAMAAIRRNAEQAGIVFA